MADRFPENRLTVRWSRLSAADRAMALVEVAGRRDEPTADSVAREALLRIEDVLNSAHEAYHGRKYGEAVAGYRRSLAAIAALVDGSLPEAAIERSEVPMPMANRLFRPLLESSLELVGALEPPEVPSEFGTLKRHPIDGSAGSFARFRRVGVQIANDAVHEARELSDIALSYAERGQWRQARTLLERARRGTTGEEGEQQTARAAIELSLAAVLIQAKDLTGAARVLQRTEQLFRSQGDVVGQAQVALNRAALLVRQGRPEPADRQIEHAEQLLSRAQGRSELRAETSVVPETPLALRRVLSLPGSLVAQSRTLGKKRRSSLEPRSLREMTAARGLAVTYRRPGGGWWTQDVESGAQAKEKGGRRSLGLLLGEEVVTFEWEAGDPLPVDAVIERYYLARSQASDPAALDPRYTTLAELAVLLPHYYFFAIPVAMGEALRQLGSYEEAEGVLRSVADYTYVNTAIEIPALWQRLAGNARQWGDSLYKQEEAQKALKIYRRVLNPPGSADVVPSSSFLYSQARLKAVGEQVKAVLSQGGGLEIGELNPALAVIVLEIRARLLQLQGGLDFLGMPADLVPIWDFSYLQSVARYFARQAVQAERQYVQFRDQAENERMTEKQLNHAVRIALAEKSLANEQLDAAQADTEVYEAGLDLAESRKSNAETDRALYEDMATTRLNEQTMRAYYTAPEHARKAVSDSVFWQGMATLDYELGALERDIEELGLGVVVAQKQVESARAREAVAEQMTVVAHVKLKAAEDQLAAFSNQRFTPDVWFGMSDFMRAASDRYLDMAVHAARLMQRAYNFELDVERSLIKTDYSQEGVDGLLGADVLLADIDSFTHDLLSSVERKKIRLKHTLSLAQRYPFQFETKFRQSGHLEFETRLLDFERAHPGTFGARIERIEVLVDGLLPPRGVHGSLTNSGISRYRDQAANVKFRVHGKETLTFSEYDERRDGALFPARAEQLELFAGGGVGGSWILEVPPSTNDVDFRAIADVRVVFYYTARFDANLRQAVEAELLSLPGAHQESRILPLRQFYPDAFFSFQENGVLTFSVLPEDLPIHHEGPELLDLSLVVAAADDFAVEGLIVRLAVPGQPTPTAATVSAEGSVIIDDGHPWQPLSSGPAVGEYRLEIRSDDNPDLDFEASAALEPIEDLALILEYDFTPRSS